MKLIRIEPKLYPGQDKRMKGLKIRRLILVEGFEKDQDDIEGDRKTTKSQEKEGDQGVRGKRKAAGLH